MLTAGVFIELIDVDQGTTRHGQGDGRIVLQVQVFRIVSPQLRREQHPTETGLSRSLIARQQWHQRISMLTVTSHPAGHHAQHPDMEKLRPVRGIGRDPVRQGRHAVFPIPSRQLVQVILDGIILIYLPGVDIPFQVTVPRFQSCLQGADSHRVLILLLQHPEGVTGNILMPELRLMRQHIEPHVIIGIHERLGAPHQQTVGIHVFQQIRLPLLQLLVCAGKHMTHQLHIFRQVRTIGRLVNGKGQGQSTLPTIHRQLTQHLRGLFLIGRHEMFVECLLQTELVGHALRLHEVTSRQQLLLLPLSPDCRCHHALLGRGIERHRRLMIEDVWIVADGTELCHRRLHHIHRHPQLRTVELLRHPECPENIPSFGGAWGGFHHHLHRPVVIPHKGHEGLGQLRTHVPQSDGLFVVFQVTDLQEQ